MNSLKWIRLAEMLILVSVLKLISGDPLTNHLNKTKQKMS